MSTETLEPLSVNRSNSRYGGDFIRLVVELAILIIGTLVISSLITPVLYTGMREALGGEIWPYSRVFDRIAMLVAVVIFAVRRSHYDLTHYKEQVGAYFVPFKWSLLLGAFFLSFILSMSALPFVVASGDLIWSSHSTDELAWRFFKTLPSAGIISIIEEVFFRFFLFLSLRRFLSFFPSAVITSLLYAIVHFIQPVKNWSFSELSLWTGFEYLSLLIERFTYEGFIPAMIGLFLVGIVLCVTVERSDSLIPAIGLHAGWVTTTKVIGKVIENAPSFSYPPGSGRRYHLLTQPVSWWAIIFVGIVSFIVFRKKAVK